MKHFTKDKPQFEHDCDCDAFLGNYTSKSDKTKYDLYYCNPGNNSSIGFTLIARYGDYGGEYKSGASFFGTDEEITEAGYRAIKAEVLTQATIKRHGYFEQSKELNKLIKDWEVVI